MADEKKCKYCAMMIPKDAAICPHCRKKQGWTWPAKIFLALIIIGMFGSFIGKNMSPSQTEIPTQKEAIPPSKPVVNYNKPAAQEKLALVDFNWESTDYGTKYIVGSVKNNTDREYKYAQISFALYDKDDAQVGSAWANINNLEASGTWKFKAVVLNQNAVSAKFKGISSY